MTDWPALLERIGAPTEPGASDEELQEAEARLGTALPPGLRSFLQTTNGLGAVTDWVRRIRPAAELVWLRDEDPALVEIWADAAGDDSLAATLVLSDEEDGARVLLNPAVVDEHGEWEAWFFAHWVPGAETFPSFAALLEQLHERHVRDKRARRGEPTPEVTPTLGVEAEDLRGLIGALDRDAAGDRANALRGIANLRDPAAAPAVAARLLDDDEDDYVRETAARTLGELRDERSVDALMAILRVPYPQGRQFHDRSEAQETAIGLKHAARQGLIALGELSRPALEDAARDHDPDVRAEARETLKYLNR